MCVRERGVEQQQSVLYKQLGGGATITVGTMQANQCERHKMPSHIHVYNYLFDYSSLLQLSTLSHCRPKRSSCCLCGYQGVRDLDDALKPNKQKS